ncbi:MAG TPA: hypothetical protein VMA53_13300 [Stellaceae bacterium]|nr:hypothetical protein [Stellaceae bacterium]
MLCMSCMAQQMGQGLAFAAALLLSTAALAQTAGTDAPPPASVDEHGVPTREGNTYDFRDHQPTQPGPPSASSAQQVEKSVQDLLHQTDELDKQSEQDERGLSGGSNGQH